MAIKRYVSVGKESSYGVAVAATRSAEAIASFPPDQGWIIPDPVASREFRKRNLGPYRTRGSIGYFPVEPENIIGELLFGVLGNVSTTNPTGSVRKHEFTGGDSLPSYTMRIGAEIERILPGGLIEALTLRFMHGANVEARADVYSGFPETDQALQTPTLSTLQALNMDESSSILKIDTTTKRAVIYGLEVNIKNNIPFDRGALDGRTFSSKRYGVREVTGKISAYFEQDEYDKFMAGTEFDLQIRADGPVITGAYKYYLELLLQKCIFLKNVAADVTPINEPLVVDAPFQAFYDSSAGYEIKAILENTIASY